jgi:hypothetical protein
LLECQALASQIEILHVGLPHGQAGEASETGLISVALVRPAERPADPEPRVEDLLLEANQGVLLVDWRWLVTLGIDHVSHRLHLHRLSLRLCEGHILGNGQVGACEVKNRVHKGSLERVETQ